MNNFDGTWVQVAREVAKKSKDPKTKVGAVIVDSDNRIVSTGYNGMVKGINENKLWEDKHPFVIHAEMNAALFSRKDYLGGCTVYVTLSPCLNCMKHLFQLGVRSIFYDTIYTKFTAKDRADLLTFMNSMLNYVVNINTMKTMQQELRDVEERARETVQITNSDV